jgi:hypothetical protein
VDDCDRNSKRPRVDDIRNNQNSLRNSWEDERRLKLIRDHGRGSSGLLPAEGGAGLMMPGVNCETNRYVQEGSGFDGNYGRPGVGKYGKVDGIPDSVTELGAIGYDSRFGSGEKRGQQYMQSNRNGFQGEEFPHSRYGQVESSLNPFQTYGIRNVDQLRPPCPVSEVPNDNYHNSQNPQQRQSSDSMPANEPQNSHMPYPEQRGSVAMDNRDPNSQLQQHYGMQYPVGTRHDFHPHGLPSHLRQPLEVRFPSHKNGNPYMNEDGGYFPSASGGGRIFENRGQMEASRLHGSQPPIPAPPLPALPVDAALHPSSELKGFSSPPTTSASLFPVAVSSSPMVPSSYPPLPEAHSLTRPYFHNEPRPPMPASAGFLSEVRLPCYTILYL